MRKTSRKTCSKGEIAQACAVVNHSIKTSARPNEVIPPARGPVSHLKRLSFHRSAMSFKKGLVFFSVRVARTVSHILLILNLQHESPSTSAPVSFLAVRTESFFVFVFTKRLFGVKVFPSTAFLCLSFVSFFQRNTFSIRQLSKEKLQFYVFFKKRQRIRDRFLHDLSEM